MGTGGDPFGKGPVLNPHAMNQAAKLRAADTTSSESRGARPAVQRRGVRGRLLRAQDHAWLTPDCRRGGPGGTCASPARPAGCSPRALEFAMWARAEEALPVCRTLLSRQPARGHRGGRETKASVWPWVCYGRNSASMRGTRPPAGFRRDFSKTFSQTSLISPPAHTNASFVCPEHIVFICSK